MREIVIDENAANQRLDKFLAKYLDKADKSFIYKMLRKKNIVLNDKKCKGDERIEKGDRVKLWLSEETVEKFHTSKPQSKSDDLKNTSGLRGQGGFLHQGGKPSAADFRKGILYEDEDCILYNKPVNMLSQKSKPTDVSLNEMLISYMEDARGEAFDKVFTPSVCNRLDRNTSGIVIFGKSLRGLQVLNACIKNRSIKKEYLCMVSGEMEVGARMHIKGYLEKDEAKNRVRIVGEEEYSKRRRQDAAQRGFAFSDDKLFFTDGKEGKKIETGIRVLEAKNGISLLLIHLITGRSHQIRAHLASIGHPILGDPKYGADHVNKKYRSVGIVTQALHAHRLTFPDEMELSNLAGRCFTAPLPECFITLGFVTGDGGEL